MSAMTTSARTRVQRTAAAAVERARLTLVPVSRGARPRAPFAVLVLTVLGVGVVGLLMFNTQLQQGSFYASSLQHQADALTAQKQRLQMQLDALRDPQAVAAAGRRLGMVAPSVPAFIDLSTGRILGDPTVATPQDAIRVAPPSPQLPPALRLPPVRRTVVLPPAGGTTGTAATNSQGAHGPASTTSGAAAGKKKPAATNTGVHR
jgi:hypothetical protein